MSSFVRRGGIVVAALLVFSIAQWPVLGVRKAANAAPVLIRMGVGPSSEEQLWLMKIRPDLTPNQGKAYTYDMEMFQGTNAKITAYEANQLDAASASTSAILFAASKQIPMTVIALMDKESRRNFSTSYEALSDAGIDLKNLKGKSIGISGFRSSLELYARLALEKAGLNVDRGDVRFVVVPLPEMGNAVRNHTIDIGVFPSTYAYAEKKRGGLTTVWTSANISGIEEEYDVFFSPTFVREHPDAVRAWGSDFVAVTKWLQRNERAAHQALLDAKIVREDPALYLGMTEKDDYDRIPWKPSVATFQRMQAELLRAKFIAAPVDVRRLVDDRFVP